MTAVSGTLSGFRTLAGGDTIRVTVDVDQQFLADFLTHIAPHQGEGVAIALLNGAVGVEPKADKPKGGELSKWCAMRCQEPEFWAFVAEVTGLTVMGDADCANVIRNWCEVESRAELDTNPQARLVFHSVFRRPWMERVGG